MNYETFKSLPAEQKRRLACEVMGYKYVRISNGSWVAMPDAHSHLNWYPESNLDQVRQIELKAKEDEKLFDKYSKILYNEILFKKAFKNEDSMWNEALLLTADEKLFALLEAFGKLGRKD